MNIALINPPNTYELQANDPAVFKGKSQGCLPPLGLLYTASAIDGEHDVMVIDCQAENLSYDDAVDILKDFKADIVGISTMTFTLIDTKILINRIKDRLNIPVIVGGPHAAIYPHECITGLGADYVIKGESELVINELLEDIPCTKNIWESLDFIGELDEIEFPERALINNSLYSSILSKKNPTTSMFSSRGCPYQCSFCDRPSLGKKFRAMSAKRVVDEMEDCESLGIKSIMFYDDTFTVSKGRVYEICAEIRKRDLKIDWDVRARVDTVDKELLEEMSKAGCKRIHFGVESASEKVLKALNKNINLEQVEKAFKDAKTYGMETLAYFMIGNPSETWDDLKKTLDYSMKLCADYVSFTIFTPFPHTELYRKALESGFIKSDVWKEYAEDPTFDFVPPVWGEHFSREELQKILSDHLRRYYLSPKFIFKKLSRLGSFKELLHLSGIALRMLK